MGAVGLDNGAAAGVSKSNARLLPRKHSGNVSPHFLEETAADNANQRHNRATASNSSNSSSSHHSNRGRRENLNQSKSLRRVSTWAICPSTQPRVISSSSSTEL